MAFWKVLASEVGQGHKIPCMVIESIVHMKTCTWWHLSQSHLPHGKKNRYFLGGHKIFAISFALFISFAFWSHFLSYLFLPSLSVKIRGFVHEAFEHFCRLTYDLLSSKSQESNFLKKFLFLVFGTVLLRILLHFPVSGSAYLFPALVLGIWTIRWHTEVLSYGILLALSIKNKRVFLTFKTGCSFCLNYAPYGWKCPVIDIWTLKTQKRWSGQD